MPQLPGAFNANEHEEMADFSALPAGDYIAQITESEKKESRNEGNFYWKLTVKILEGEFKGRQLWENLNLINRNEQAVEIANRTLASICKACGKVAIEDTTELHGTPMTISVKQTPATPQYPPGNKISKWAPAEGYAQPAQPAEAKAEATEDAPAQKKRPWED